MKKMRKGKKMLIICIILIIAIIAAIFIINNVVNKGPGKDRNENENQVIQLPETTYSDMEVKNLQMEYLKNNNETMVSMEIHNTTNHKVEDENLDVYLVDSDEQVLGQILTSIDVLGVGEQYNISVVLHGDLTTTTRVKLVKREN